MKHPMNPGVAAGVASGAVVSADFNVGKNALSKIFTNPLVLFGLGVAVSYCLYK